MQNFSNQQLETFIFKVLRKCVNQLQLQTSISDDISNLLKKTLHLQVNTIDEHYDKLVQTLINTKKLKQYEMQRLLELLLQHFYSKWQLVQYCLHPPKQQQQQMLQLLICVPNVVPSLQQAKYIQQYSNGVTINGD